MPHMSLMVSKFEPWFASDSPNSINSSQIESMTLQRLDFLENAVDQSAEILDI